MNRLWRILLVEDDEDDYILAREMLSAAHGAKCQIEWARTFDEGRAALEGPYSLTESAKTFDAVLMDYDLGTGSGIDLIREATRRGFPAPFVLLTGRGSYETDVEAMEAGASVYLTKSEVNALLLERSIRYAIERKQIEAELRASNERLASELSERRRVETALTQIEWLLTRGLQPGLSPALSPENGASWKMGQPAYGDLTELNTNRFLLDTVGKDVLENLAADYMDLLETSTVVHEKNGDYALNVYQSSWCRTLDAASRKLCGTSDNRQALESGKWLCQNSCWMQASKPTIETGLPVDIECEGGLHIFAAPITAGGEVVGSINFGYGEPPRDEHELQVIAQKYQVPVEELVRTAGEYETRPPYMVDLARKRLLGSARLLGALVERKQAERALQTANEQLRQGKQRLNDILGSIRDGFFELDRQWRFTYINTRAAHNAGFEPEMLVGESVWEKFPFMASREYEDIFHKVMETRQPERMEIKSPISEIWFAVAVYPSTNGISVFWSDITSRKNADTEREELLREANRQRRQLEAIFASMEDAVAVMDAKGHFYLVNDAFSRFHRFKSDTDIKLNLAEFYDCFELHTLDGEQLPIEEWPAQKALRGERLRDYDVIVRRTDTGEEWTGRYNTELVYNDQGELAIVVYIIRDITESLQAKEAVRESESKYRELFENLPIPACLLEMAYDDQGQIVDWIVRDANHYFVHAMGHQSKDDILDKRFSEHLGFENAEHLIADSREIMASGAVHTDTLHYSWNERDYLISRFPIGKQFLMSTSIDITAIKKSQESAENERARLRAILDTIPVGIGILDERGNLVESNDLAAKVWGIESKDNLPADGEAYKSQATSGEGAGLKEFIAMKVLQGESFYDQEVEIERFDGTMAAILASAAPIIDSSGNLIGAVATGIDITERKQAEDENAYGATLLESAMDAIHSTDLTPDMSGRTILSWNKAAELMYGYQACEIVGKTTNIFESEYPGKHREEVRRELLEQGYWRGEVLHRRKDGSRVHVLSSVSMVKDKQGKAIGTVAVNRDITGRIQMEAELKKSEEKYRDLIKHAPSGIYEIDFKIPRFLNVNDLMCEYLGYTREELLAIDPFDLLDDESKDLFKERIRKRLAGDKVEYKIRAKDGREIYAVLSVTITFRDGKPDTAMVIAHDVTERKLAEEAVKRYASELTRSNQALEEFAFVASHDLQEPLRKIQSFSEQLVKHYAPDLGDEGQDWLERMQRSAERMQQMINDLLIYSRVSTTSNPFAPVDLNQVAEDVVMDLEVRMKETGGEVQIDPLPTIQADGAQMHQLLLNLIGNALKFQRPGVPPRVQVSSQMTGPGFCEIYIQDNGIGFDMEQLDRIFQPFQRLHGRSQYEGTGIGLATCRKIAERHGGQITARSAPGHGTLFVVKLKV